MKNFLVKYFEGEDGRTIRLELLNESELFALLDNAHAKHVEGAAGNKEPSPKFSVYRLGPCVIDWS